MNMNDIANSAKITVIWRVGLATCSILGTAGVAAIFGYVKSSDEKLSRIDGDVNQIKWELPVIKSTINADKFENQKKLEAIENKIEALRSSGQEQTKEIARLQLEQAVIKQKLQMP